MVMTITKISGGAAIRKGMRRQKDFGLAGLSELPGGGSLFIFPPPATYEMKGKPDLG
jgi:hypothetical protein